MNIDLNCDMGESVGNNIIGNDGAIFPFITSCNIACGFHGGDPYHMQKTIDKALEYNLRIGAHPSYPDLEGFGRRKMKIKKTELKSILKYQISALKGMVESCGGNLSYVKPHGALYNTASENPEETRVIINSIQDLDENLALMGLANSNMEIESERAGVKFIAEAFADRKYNADGRLKSREDVDSMIYDPDEAVKQVASIFLDKKIYLENNVELKINVDSICIHGDNPNAVGILAAINQFISSQS